MPKTNSVLSNLKFSIKKLLFLVQGYDRIHISSIFDSKNAFANFHTHDFMGSKHMLKCFSLGCKHYEALFRTKWSSQTQKVKIFIKWLQVIVTWDTRNLCCFWMVRNHLFLMQKVIKNLKNCKSYLGRLWSLKDSLKNLVIVG